MDRRQFVAGLLGIAGAAALATALRPVEAVAGVMNPDMASGTGVLDLLDESAEANVEQVWHHGRPHYYRDRRPRRWAWRRVCRRFRVDGRWRRRCVRRRVWLHR